jgi:lipoic acid synthetase
MDQEASPNLTLLKKTRLNVLPSHADAEENGVVPRGRFPSWLHRKLPKGGALHKTGQVLSENRLHTVCEEAKCPNLWECWSKKTATFLVMGKECSRNCGFCDIDFSKSPKALDEDEPVRVAMSVNELQLKHVVITMVARDDLADGGSRHLVKVVDAIRSLNSNVTIEVLTSDFMGRQESLSEILDAKPEIFNHNIETVRVLTPRVRHKATYERTLEVLKFASQNRIHTGMKIKSGLMIGLGETEEQVFETLRDLQQVGCDIVTIGQYLQANPRKLLVKAFIHPDQFKRYEEYGYSIGIPYLYCGPFVRSSYNANVVLQRANQETVIIQST